jgi:ABC-2 type transport system ATP-binding protein
VLLTTHYMYEADALCDRIAVISRGEIVATGTPSDLKSVVADRTVVEIEAYGAPDDAIERLRRAPGVTSVAVEDREQAQLLVVQSPEGSALTQQLLSYLDGVRVGRVAAREPTLEDAYVSLVTERD